MSTSLSPRSRAIVRGTLAGIALALAGTLWSLSPATSTGTADDEKPAEAVYTNIQVLKGLPETHVNVAMLGMATALGVACDHCHTNDFSQDRKSAKDTARSEMRMMQRLNAEVFAGRPQLTCYTCHQGHLTPLVAAPVAPGASRHGIAAAASTTVDWPTSDEILARYHAAIGGRVRFEAIRSVVLAGTETRVSGRAVPPSGRIEILRKAPGRLRITRTFASGGTFVQAYDGEICWSEGGGNVRRAAGPDLALARRDANILFHVDLEPQFTKLEVTGEGSLEGRSVWVLEGTPRDGTIGSLRYKTEILSFDKETKLLLRRHMAIETPLAPLPVTIDFEDYREVDGLKMPFVVHLAVGSDRISQTFREIALDVPVDDSRFSMPGEGR